MTNKFVFDIQTHPVYSRLVNTYKTPGIIAPPETSASKAGNLYITTATTSASLGLLGGSVSIAIQITNSTAKSVYISAITGGLGVSLNLLSSLTGTTNIISGGTLTTPTTLIPTNANFSSTNTSAMTVRSSTAAVTGGTTFWAMPLNGGIFETNYTGSIIVPNTKSITVTLSGSLTVAGILSTTLNVSWWEI
ncbi:hypothetical protein NV379_08385 [Paenibacillus sp. N1-5-1-14]|uniref:hypothetical protein n=1 Tax=Paenibacillus radicibacter TaxID=2972488 RepID=UPI002159A234|nr:hypothetical protein [Paenibacillus radicibacter]MCR8642679.1 hypothetical protein [Paenibacillus radicibacter]